VFFTIEAYIFQVQLLIPPHYGGYGRMVRQSTINRSKQNTL
jgi:hypothetical protein